MIQRDYPEYFESNINFNAVLHDKNSVKDIYEFIFNRYHKVPTISELNNVDVDPAKRDIFENLFHDLRDSSINYQKEENNLIPHSELISYHELTNFLKYLSINTYIADITASLHDASTYWPSSTCLPFSKKIFLTTSNNLLACERINGKYILGKVTDEVSIDFKEIARQYSNYYQHLKKVCQYCYLYRFCGLCMFHIKDLDSLGSEQKFSCDLFHNQSVFRAKLQRILSFLEKHPSDYFNILEDLVIES